MERRAMRLKGLWCAGLHLSGRHTARLAGLLPLPMGEGRGEGALALDHLPVSDALRHSLFEVAL